MSKSRKILSMKKSIVESMKDAEDIISLIKSKVKDGRTEDDIFTIVRGTYLDAPEVFIKAMIKKFKK